MNVLRLTEPRSAVTEIDLSNTPHSYDETSRRDKTACAFAAEKLLRRHGRGDQPPPGFRLRTASALGTGRVAQMERSAGCPNPQRARVRKTVR